MPGRTRGAVAPLRCILQGENFLLSKVWETSFQSEQKSWSCTSRALRGRAGLEVAAHKRRTPQKSDKIKGSSLPRPPLPSLPRTGSKIKVKNVSMEGTDERLIINFRAAIQHFLKCKFDAQKWHIMISRSNKGEWVQEGLLLRDRLARNTYSQL